MEQLLAQIGPIRMIRKGGQWTVGNWQFSATGDSLDEALYSFLNSKIAYESWVVKYDA